MTDNTPASATPSQPNALQPADYNQKRADKYQKQALIDLEVANDIRYNPEYDEFFEPYQLSVREQLARSYANRRGEWVAEGTFYEGYLAGMERRAEAEAYSRLWDIQQKKLFDLQCQWRAELITVPGVRFSGDFQTLSAHIENSTVVAPITREDLDLYLAWVKQANYAEHLYERISPRFSWQEYDEIRMYLDPDADGHEARIIIDGAPEWYEYHNLYTGNDRLLRLPNLRGEKEKRYQYAHRDVIQAELAARHAATPPPPLDPRPSYLGLEDERALQGEFAQLYESRTLNRQREAYEAGNPVATWEDEELERALFFLKEQPGPIPIQAGSDWRMALREAMYSYRHQELLRALPLVYEAYLQRQAWGVAQPCHSEVPRHEVPDYHVNAILNGREALGEPRNFDF